MFTMPKPYPREFREDVIRVARNREPGVRTQGHRRGLRDLRVVPDELAEAADVEDGIKPGVDGRRARREPRAAKRRIRLLEQENEVLRRAAAYLSQANLPGKCCTRSSVSSPSTGSPSR